MPRGGRKRLRVADYPKLPEIELADALAWEPRTVHIAVDAARVNSYSGFVIMHPNWAAVIDIKDVIS
jgi:hypothetical protein